MTRNTVFVFAVLTALGVSNAAFAVDALPPARALTADKLVCPTDTSLVVDPCVTPLAPKPPTDAQKLRYKQQTQIIKWFFGPNGPGTTPPTVTTTTTTRDVIVTGPATAPVTTPTTTPGTSQTPPRTVPPTPAPAPAPATQIVQEGSTINVAGADQPSVATAQGGSASVTIIMPDEDNGFSTSTTDIREDAVHFGVGMEGIAGGHEPVSGVTGGMVYILNPSFHARIGDDYGVYFEGEGGPIIGHWRAYGVTTSAGAGFAAGVLEGGVKLGYSNYGVWDNLDKKCCDVAYKSVDASVTVGANVDEVRVSLTGTVGAWNVMEVAGSEDSLPGGHPLAIGLGVTWFPKAEGRRVTTVSQASSARSEAPHVTTTTVTTGTSETVVSERSATTTTGSTNPDEQPVAPSGVSTVQEVDPLTTFIAPRIERRPPH